MKKYILLLLLALSFSVPSYAQRAKASLTASTTDCTVAASCLTTYVTNTDGGATFTLSGTFSATEQFEATGDGGTTWVALSVTPSNSTTTVTSATGVGTWQANVSGFTGIRIRVSAFTSGTVVASISLSTASARAGGGGSGSGTVSGQASGVIPLGTTATTITQQSHLDDGVTTASTVTSSEAIAAPSFGAGTAPAACGTATGCWGSTEAATAGTPTTSQDYQRRDSVTHHDICSWNNGAETSCNPGIPASWTSGHVASLGTWPAMADGGAVAANIVVASSPGAGIARFAGSTQTATSAELSGDVTTSGSNATTVVKVNGAVVPTSAKLVASNASNQVIAATLGNSFSNPASNTATGEFGAVAQNASKANSFYISSWTGTLSNLSYFVTTADNTANVYDLGIYGPGCNAGGTLIPLVVHTGPIAGTTLFAGTGAQHAALTGAPVTVTMPPGWYCFVYTSSAAAPAAVMGGDAVNIHLRMFADGASVGATSSGTLASTITAPATTVSIGPTGYIAGY